MTQKSIHDSDRGITLNSSPDGIYGLACPTVCILAGFRSGEVCSQVETFSSFSHSSGFFSAGWWQSSCLNGHFVSHGISILIQSQ